MNPGMRIQCRLCKTYCKASDNVVECEDCEKRFHASCGKLGDDELLKLESGNASWYCTNCKADCGLCSGAVLNAHNAVTVTDVRCVFRMDALSLQKLSMELCKIQIIPGFARNVIFSTYFDDQLNFENRNRFDPLTKTETGSSSFCTSKNNFINGLKFVSMTINSIRDKTFELLAFPDFQQPHVVTIQETKIDGSIATSELFPVTSPYNVYRKDRNLHGGGMMLLIHMDISHMSITELENNSESVWVKEFVNKASHYVASWYRQPGGTSEDFQLFRDQLDHIRNQHKCKNTPLGSFCRGFERQRYY